MRATPFFLAILSTMTPSLVIGQETTTYPPLPGETGTYPPTPPETPPPENVIQAILSGIGSGFLGTQNFPPIHHWPEEEGLAYENVTFTSEDGVSCSGWFIPAQGSDKIIIANHPRWFNRAGIPEYSEADARAPGSWWAVNFVPDYKILHDAGYNILAYDYRNHGLTDSTYAHTLGLLEAHDVAASLRYVRSREDTKHMKIGLFSRCVGANANLHASTLYPELFENVQAQVFAQPLTVRVRMSRIMEYAGISDDYSEAVSDSIRNTTGYGFADYELVPLAEHVQIPTFVFQVHDDFNTRPSDVQSVFDAIPIEDKKLYWIQGTNRRWHAYSWFQEHPEQVVDWFDRLMV
ncbi:unnamed protein product [Clonostachys rosea]|uniref:Alpha/beta hydrolase n=1 Tax=Bionectria ochroleuca TaxID=29856 RepID=A0ABY6V4L9_BIOOC|nr:unnamed protein product [Clonostachys rosea]